MGNSHSAQHNLHQHHPHDPRNYRPYHHHGEIAYPPEDPRWSMHSFPRDMHRRGPPPHGPMRGPEMMPENKVLPKVLGPPPKLRSTNNGAILHQGGTISGRKLAQGQNVAPVKAYKAKVDRSSPNSRLSANRFGGSEPDLRAPSNFRAPPAPLMVVNHQKAAVRISANAAAAAANKKKYKAPPPPPKQDSESPSDTSGWEDTGSAAPKKTRLFKTRTQTSGNSPAPSNDARKPEESKPRAPINAAAAAFLAKKSVSSPEFQQELVKAAQLKHKERQAKQHQAPEAQKAAPASQPQNKGSPTPTGPRHAPVGRESSNDHREVKENHRPSRARSPLLDQSAKKQPPVTAQPPKTFYFGMDVGGGVAAADEDEVDRFAARLRNPKLRRKRSSSGSGGSYTEDEIPNHDGDINLQLRPVLPKKTPDIPRFSPTAAWRQLLVGDLPDDPEDDPRGRRRNRSVSPILRETSGTAALLEERIVQCYSQRAPLLVRGSVATQEKSGDSGISGDASPGPGQNMLDSPDPAPAAPSRLRKHHSPVARQWTPEQDLDDSSSDDDQIKATARASQARRAISEERPAEVISKSERGRSSGRVTPPKFTRRSHMFSLSLPRPDQLQIAAQKGPDDIDSPLESPNENLATFHSLKKFKKSVSGALGSAFQMKYNSQQQLSLDENWYLSRSAPNSLDSTGDGPGWQKTPIQSDEGVCWNSPNESSSPEQFEEVEEVEEVIKLGKKPLSHIASGSHIMYLPEYDSRRCMMPRMKSKQLHAGQRSLSVDVLTQLNNQEKEGSARNNNSLLIIKNNINERPQEMRELRPESPWEVPHQGNAQDDEEQALKAIKSKLSGKAGKKFTFQSTIRQIERRRVADRLSKEAEMREKQRRQEAEAMKRVEEEFQRKRAREKANLKEQLRLYSLQDSEGPQSLPVMALEEPRIVSRSKTRTEPEGQAAAKVQKKSIYKQIAQSIQEEDQPGKHAKQAEPREYKDYIANPAKINRFPSGERASPSPSSSSASSNTRRNVTHPAIICDIPKTSQAYLGPIFAESDLKIVPEAHNYRREFAKGAVNGGPSASSKVPRARLSPSPSPSPKEQQDGGASRGHSQYNGFTSLPPQQSPGSSSSSSTSKLSSSKVPALQPFSAAKTKGFRPIGFKAPSSSASPTANTKPKVMQAVN
ncbi:uncharacterized protein LOC135938820 isoform X2 [Cloeon dipterum]|uniref:uncharacterized protein LOC135938820 isoform X2 n=1 Tax=Cloeon dipterum TaxID=197152 RepID=UPI003220334B